MSKRSTVPAKGKSVEEEEDSPVKRKSTTWILGELAEGSGSTSSSGY
jgi:hypothetical protein